MIPYIDQMSDWDHYLTIWITFVCTISLLVKQLQLIEVSLVAKYVIQQYLPKKHDSRFGTKVWLTADCSNAYVLQWYVYEGAKYDPSSRVAGSGYDVVICLMEMAKCFDKGHHQFTNSLFTTYAAAAYLLQRGSFLTGAMHWNQLHHLPNEITTVKPKVRQKMYFRQDKFLAMLYRQKQSQNKLVMLQATVVPAMVDL